MRCKALVFSTPNNASLWDIFHIKNNQLIILYGLSGKCLKEILISVKVLSQKKLNLDSSKFKYFADEKFEFDEKGEKKKLLVTNNLSYSCCVFKRLFL